MDREQPPEQGGANAESVVSAVDRGDDGAEFVIADVTADGKWITVPYGEALTVAEWA
jgi:hypothetical protein